jgi:putative copper resistance protein D
MSVATLDLVNLLGAALRWVHLAACVGLAGIAAFLLLAGRTDLAGPLRWRERMLGWSRRLVLLALATGVLVLAHQTVVFEGRLGAAVDPAALGRVLLGTQVGLVWLLRHGVLLVLALLLWARLDESRRADWVALRTQVILLGFVALGFIAASGHAAAVEPDTGRVLGIAAVHLLATGLWVGGLPALATVLGMASRENTDAARAYAARATRRFSQLALGSVIVLAATGIGNSIAHVGSVPALVGTPYGRLLLLKLALLAVILALAAVARRRLVPALAASVAAFGRLRRIAVSEATLAGAILGVVAVMSLTKPARHDQPTWPFAFRWVTSAEADAAIGLPQAVLDAHPTTYMRPAVPYTVSSIVSGAALYEQHCAACHGADGSGDGPLARGLPRPPVDLRSGLLMRTAGDLFWRITHGEPEAGKPAFASRLSDEHRWDLVNFVRTLEAADGIERPEGDLAQRRVVAPDFIYSVGPIPPRALRDLRGDRMVLLVLYSLPESRPRMSQLAQAIDALDLFGVEIIAVPTDAAPDAIRRLGAERGMYYAVVTDGAPEIVSAYRMLAGGASHAEFLIDRQGYIRPATASAVAAPRSVEDLLAEVQRLRGEQPAPPAEEHIH